MRVCGGRVTRVGGGSQRAGLRQTLTPKAHADQRLSRLQVHLGVKGYLEKQHGIPSCHCLSVCRLSNKYMGQRAGPQR